MIPTFSLGPDVADAVYRHRDCVYGVTFDAQGRVLVVRYKGRLVLPGGGRDPGETEIDALVRECVEETGFRVEVGAHLGRARQLVSRPERAKFRDKSCAFYRVRITESSGSPTEPNHEPVWMSVRDASQQLEYGSHLWAVELATVRSEP